MKSQNAQVVARFLCLKSIALFTLIFIASSFKIAIEQPKDDCHALILAAQNEDFETVKSLLKSTDPNCVFPSDMGPRTALVAASRKGNLRIAQLLIDNGANIKKHASADETPLMAASGSGNLELVKLFVDKGAKINKKVYGDGTALIYASRNGHEKLVSYLINEGAKVNASVPGDGTALICAVANEHYEAAKILLENGADPAQSSPGDENPIYHAYESGDKALIKLITQYLD